MELLDAAMLKAIFLAASAVMEQNKAAVDALNVFPVPDGDTGTNMSLTLIAAAREVNATGSEHVGKVAQAAALGSLMGARGNSGVILSQLLRGLAKGLEDKQVATPLELAHALELGVETAYKAVMKPVEGTILTVAREAAAAATAAARAGAGLQGVWGAAGREAARSLARTPDLLPVLKQAGVVDAGGKGLVYLFEAGAGALRGESPAQAAATNSRAVEFAVTEEMADIRFPYDAQFLIRDLRVPPEVVRTRLEPFGDSLLVVGTSEVARVHIHTDRPGEVLSLCLGLGSLHQIVIDNMIAQHQELVGSDPAPAGESPASGPELLRDLGVVTVAPGDGLTEVFKSLGADVVIDGGPTMNPSTQDVAEAVTRVNARKVIFLPNNGNIILAAKQAKRLVGRRMYIVPSRTVPQGLAALLALKPDANMGTNLKRAAKAMKQVKTGEVTYAVRQSRFDGHTINPGDVLGLFNGTIKVVGADADQVLYDLLGVMVGERDEIITVFYGSEVPEERASAVGSEVAGRFDFLDVEVRRGGQELYYYIVAVE